MCNHNFKHKISETSDYNIYECYQCCVIFMVAKDCIGVIEDRTVILPYLGQILQGEIECIA